MSYDFDGCEDRSPPELYADKASDPKDLETIVTVLEVAAILLTPEPGARFTFDQLVAEANDMMAGALDVADVRIVVASMGRIIRKVSDGTYELR